jgi:transposase
MKALSMDLRERILKVYEQEDCTREQVARRFAVSVGMVKKLLSRKRQGQEIGARYDRCGGKARIVESHRRALRSLLEQKPDMTLAQLRDALELDCTLPAIHYVLRGMGLTYKKRRSMPANKAVRTSSKDAPSGSAARAGSIPRGSSSLMSRRPKRT